MGLGEAEKEAVAIEQGLAASDYYDVGVAIGVLASTILDSKL
jgi:hypothetical protein